MQTVSHPGRPAAATHSTPQHDAFGVTRPMLLWAVVLALTMLSFYVHLINAQMLRAQLLHAAPLAGVQQAKAAPRGPLSKPRRAPQTERVAVAP